LPPCAAAPPSAAPDEVMARRTSIMRRLCALASAGCLYSCRNGQKRERDERKRRTKEREREREQAEEESQRRVHISSGRESHNHPRTTKQQMWSARCVTAPPALPHPDFDHILIARQLCVWVWASFTNRGNRLTTSSCSQNTVQLMTANMVHVTNLTPPGK
jgi:hypothetical protein